MGFHFLRVAYLSLFAVPIFARKDRGIRPRLVAPCCRFRVSLYTALCASLGFPIIDVASRAAYASRWVARGWSQPLWSSIYRLGSRAAARTTLEPSSGTS